MRKPASANQREARAQRILAAAGNLDLPTRCASALLTGSERGGPRRFDLVIRADGLHSAVRRLTGREKSGVLSILSATMQRRSWQRDILIGIWQGWLPQEVILAIYQLSMI